MNDTIENQYNNPNVSLTLNRSLPFDCHQYQQIYIFSDHLFKQKSIKKIFDTKLNQFPIYKSVTSYIQTSCIGWYNIMIY